MVLPAGLVRLGDPLPPEVADDARLLAGCRTAGVRVPVGAVLLAGHDDLGPLVAGEHVLLRVVGTSPAVRVPTTPRQLAVALRTLRLAAPVGVRHDVLVLRAEASVHAGRVLVGNGASAVRAVEGEAHELRAAARVRELTMPRLRTRWQRAHRGLDEWRTPLPPWAMRLSGLVRDAQRVLGTSPHELTFADDGQRCRLLGVRVTTR